ncbi:hypothetical protein NKJ28_31175 [Mesorhizobium sp. M0145]|uniref:hypothetical protein n=1 Tax=Mesorhizobium sp. M0145 TaxID=2956895 RepID=UPI003339F5A2
MTAIYRSAARSRRNYRPEGSTRGNCVRAAGINLRQPGSGLGHTPLRGPYRAAERNIDADAAVFIQHLVRTFEGDLRSVTPLSGSRQFHIQKFHYSASITVPSIGKPLVIGFGCPLYSREEPGPALNPTYPYIVHNDLSKVANLKQVFPNLYGDKPALVMSTSN